MIELKKYIRDIPNFPKQGIVFKDITPLLKDSKAFADAVDRIADEYKDKKVDVILSVEARGFIFGAAVAYKMGVGLAPVRKPGKLPHRTHSVTYDLEYGKDTLQIHQDAFSKGAKILIVDDLLATGGTTQAVASLVERMGGEIAGIAFVIELLPLKGREKLKKFQVTSLIKDEYC